MQPLKSDWFLSQVPGKPMGRYAHIILVRVTDSYPLFQTDGELNTARVSAGEVNKEIVTRLSMFKRKQSTPERLVGRELLRRYGFLSGDMTEKGVKIGSDGRPICDYNVQFCTECPDCITYGFAIGDSGSEKSKVITDTAYSLTTYADSHEVFTLNAPYEGGTMARQGVVTSRINEQDHIQPQVIFPTVVTARDLTLNLFLYVLNNVARTRRYGAQTTRTGKIHNHLVGVALTDGEIFSNLKFTQRLYDSLQAKGKIMPPDPVEPGEVVAAAAEVVPKLLAEDGVQVAQFIGGAELKELLAGLQALVTDESRVQQLLQDAFNDSRAYHKVWIEKSSEKKQKK
jgi:CRISPR-associated protein Csc2